MARAYGSERKTKDWVSGTDTLGHYIVALEERSQERSW